MEDLFQRQNFCVDPGSVTLSIHPRLHGSGTVFLGGPCGARRFNYKSFSAGKRPQVEGAPEQSLDFLVSQGKRRDPVHHDMAMAPSHWQVLAQGFLPLLACTRGIFVIIVNEFLHGSHVQEKLCLECAVVVT